MESVKHPTPADNLGQWRRRLNILVVAVFAVLDLTSWFVPSLLPGNYWSIGLYWLAVPALIAAQISLLSAWIALGEEKFLQRSALVFPGCLLVDWLLARGMQFNNGWRTFAFILLLLYLIGAIIPFAVLRLFDVHCMAMAAPGETPQSTNTASGTILDCWNVQAHVFCGLLGVASSAPRRAAQ